MLCEFYLNKKINIKKSESLENKIQEASQEAEEKRDEKQKTIRLTYQSRGTSIQVTRQKEERRKKKPLIK